MRKVLYADGCFFREKSRTEQLAQAYLRKLLSADECRIETVVLEEAELKPLDGAALLQREKWINAGDLAHDCFRFAQSFAEADELVIAAPYWDLSFPSLLKIYLEHLCIRNLTFRYSDQGFPIGLTKVRRVVYITTAGGWIQDRNFGFDYVKGLMQSLFSVAECRFISAEGLDIKGNDPRSILEEAVKKIPIPAEHPQEPVSL